MGREYHMKEKKILVVDDAFFMRNLLGNTLKDIGYTNIYFAENGQNAVEKALEIRPDLVTLDISMPIMDGIEAVEKIIEACPSCKIVMVSAVTNQNAVKQALMNGAVDFIKKPFDKNELEKVMKKHLDIQ